MRKLVTLAAAVLIMMAGASCTRHRAEPEKDAFGVAMLHKSADKGMAWNANWSGTRKLHTTKDPADPWFTMSNSTSSFYSVENDTLIISGRDPRMYIREPDLKRQWRDVEITMYFMRRSDDNTPYAGMVAVARSNHGANGSVEKNLCDSRGYGSRLRYDGFSDFEKEISHPHNDAHRAQKIWDDGMPYDKWLGYKFLVYDLPDGSVKLEQWLDESGGENGGRWRKINEAIDDGTFWGEGETACKAGVDPAMALTNKGSRRGSESGKPNVSVYFRSDTVNTRGLIYRWGSVREITR